MTLDLGHDSNELLLSFINDADKANILYSFRTDIAALGTNPTTNWATKFKINTNLVYLFGGIIDRSV
jgi:hypothetical protein